MHDHARSNWLVFTALLVMACCPMLAVGQDFATVSALGDSLTDVEAARGPSHVEHITAMLDVEFNNFAVTGATTTTLLADGQHTQALDAGTTFAFVWIGANDLLFENATSTALGDTTFLSNVVAQWEEAVDALLDEGATVITANLPDLSRLPLADSGLFPQAVLGNVQSVTVAFNELLAEAAKDRGVPVVDVFATFNGFMDSDGTVCGVSIDLPPEFGEKDDLFFDSIHPSSFGMGLVTNAFIEVMNDEFDTGLSPLSDQMLVALAEEQCDTTGNDPDDDDDDGVPNDQDVCPGEDDNLDTDSDTTPDCLDGCPNDGDKTEAGVCGCGEPDVDSDDDGAYDCNDDCPDDPDKTQPGACGCGEADTDTDEDGVADCEDNCRTTGNSDQADADGDGVGDACDSGGPSGFCGAGMIGFLPLMIFGLASMRRGCQA